MATASYTRSPRHPGNESAPSLHAVAIRSWREPYLGVEHLSEVLGLTEPALLRDDRRRKVRLHEQPFGPFDLDAHYLFLGGSAEQFPHAPLHLAARQGGPLGGILQAQT